MKTKVEIARENMMIKGFTVKEGYILFKECDDIVAISSGYYDIDLMYIYTQKDSEWVGNWEDDLSFPVEEAIEIVKEYQKQKEMEELKLEIKKLIENGVSLYISNEPIMFTDIVAGEKASDGGEYGFYSTYYPTELDGVYEYYTSTTCEFDSCGTGYEGLVIITKDKYDYLANEEKKLYEEETE